MLTQLETHTGVAGSVMLEDVLFQRESYWTTAGGFGMKGNVAQKILVTFNLRFAITDAGLTDRLAPLLGLEWSF
jgi:hypothetical protein